MTSVAEGEGSASTNTVLLGPNVLDATESNANKRKRQNKEESK